MKEKILQILKQHWGYDSFLPLQEDIIYSVLNNRDCLALLPTGGGKSLTYQIPGLVKEGTCLVITPLISLMKDQVESLHKKDIDADAIFSGMSFREIESVLNKTAAGKTKFLYVSPERLETELFKNYAPLFNINLIAVDEAHCISEWGYDFRPPYLRISAIRDIYPKIPVLALTSTATKEVKADIITKLKLNNSLTFQESYERKNIIYAILKEDNKRRRLVDILKKEKGSCIVYAKTRKNAQEISDLLIKNNLSANYYHAGLNTTERNTRQEDWMNDKTSIMVATNAFGMGIDKSDVRMVIHFSPPESLEAYYQETGRAGRDGKRSYSVTFVNENDKTDLERHLETSFPSKTEIVNTYQQLANFLQLPVGTGKGCEFDFNFSDFIANYNLNSINTYNSLKILETEGYIILNESIFSQSKIKIIVSHEQILDYMKGYKNYKPLIQAILRSYPGIFDYYINIYEDELVKRINSNKEQVIKNLEYLTKSNILDYIPPKDNPQLFYVTERIDTNNLYINSSHLEIRKKIFRNRLNSVIQYFFKSSDCRSRYLLSYFGETKNNRCRHCDLCLKIHEPYVSEEEFSMIRDNIYELLKENSLPIDEIINSFITLKNDKIISTIRWLIDEKKLLLDSNYQLHMIS